MKLSKYMRHMIKVMRQKGLGWEDVCFLLQVNPDDKMIVKSYYFQSQRGTRETGLQASQQRMG